MTTSCTKTWISTLGSMRKTRNRKAEMRTIFRLIALMLLLSGSIAAWAQQPDAPAQALPWAALSADEQRVLDSVHAKWEQLPPGAQQRLQRAAQRYARMNSEQHAKLDERLRKWNSASPEQ